RRKKSPLNALIIGTIARDWLPLALTLCRLRLQPRDLRKHAREQPSRQTTLSQQQPVARVLDQTSAGFHQALPQAGQRPGAAPCRLRPAATGCPVVGDHVQPQSLLSRAALLG